MSIVKYLYTNYCVPTLVFKMQIHMKKQVFFKKCIIFKFEGLNCIRKSGDFIIKRTYFLM